MRTEAGCVEENWTNFLLKQKKELEGYGNLHIRLCDVCLIV